MQGEGDRRLRLVLARRSAKAAAEAQRTSCILADMTLAACLADGLVMYCSASTSLSSVSLSMAMGRGPTPALPLHGTGVRVAGQGSGLVLGVGFQGTVSHASTKDVVLAAEPYGSVQASDLIHKVAAGMPEPSEACRRQAEQAATQRFG